MAMQAMSAEAQYLAIGAASGKFTNAMVPGIVYRFTANTDCWVCVAATGGAAQASTANNHFCISGQVLLLCNPDTSSTANAFVHVIRNTADGKGTLSPMGPG